ncbi:hypothetical protein QR680_005113 [Steinernema hermaphroditum]|uniref:SRR1-like domain-containing protein n=1 Tax=Steinernema hermaphroditum TaxID=289476 RepID=A0AA39HQW0_9BILA|nr:hypothetical protein QR680_005113 [Steinernema hermaphroditum]
MTSQSLVALETSGVLSELNAPEKNAEGRRRFGVTPITLPEVLETLSNLVAGRSVRLLKFLWTLEDRSLYRNRGLEIVTIIKYHFSPRRTVFEDCAFSREEEECLRRMGIVTSDIPQYQDLSEECPAENEVDIVYGVHCSVAVLNDFLWSRWTPRGLKGTILITTTDCLCQLSEVDHFSDFVENGTRTDLLSYRIHKIDNRYITNSKWISAFSWKQDTVECWKRPRYYWCPVPTHLHREETPGLKMMSTFEHISENIAKIEEELEKRDYVDEIATKVQKVLGGRRVERITLVGVCSFAMHYHSECRNFHDLQQLMLTLALRKKFNPTTVRCHEPVLTPFEKSFLNSIGIETPPASDMSTPEEGLAEDEVTLFYMPGCVYELENMVIWANRKNMRNVVFITYPLDRCENLEKVDKTCRARAEYREKAETIRTSQQSLGFRLHIVMTREHPDGFPWLKAALPVSEISSFPENALETVSDEKPRRS